ncbi:MAG: hypothetical protein HFG29_03840 [Eubacterium sp.]|nr:hypothetical protein [Eubacterium sp.]
MSRKSKQSTRAVIRYFITFVLMVSLVGISLMAYGKYSMLSVHGVINSCERVKYFKDICGEMETEAYYLGIPFGITKKEIKGVFEEKEIRQDVTNIIVSMKNGNKPRIDTYELRKRMEEKITAKEGLLNAKQKESLSAYISQVENMYQKKVYIPGTDSIVNMITIADRIVLIGIPLLLFIIIISIFYLISSRRYVHHGLRSVAYSFIGAGITLVTVFAGMISDRSIYRFNISDVYMRKFFTFWIGHEMLMQVFAGIMLLMTGALLVYLVIRQKSRVR